MHQPSKERILAGGLSGKAAVELFEDMANEAKKADLPDLTLLISFLDKDDKVEKGTYIPEVYLVLRRVDE